MRCEDVPMSMSGITDTPEQPDDRTPAAHVCVTETWRMQREQSRSLRRIIEILEGDPMKQDGLITLHHALRREFDEHKKACKPGKMSWPKRGGLFAACVALGGVLWGVIKAAAAAMGITAASGGAAGH